jgi:RND family efflux transporter MFP subunit
MSTGFRFRWLGLAWLVALLAIAGCGGEHAGNGESVERQAVRAETTTAQLRSVTDRIEVTGSIEPQARVLPGTKIMGRIETVTVDVGDRVRRGQVLAALEKRDLEAAVEQARAAIRMAEARLSNARTHYERIVDLHSRGSVTEKNLEDATAGYRVAEAGLQQAKAALASAEVNLDYATIRSPVDGYVTEKKVEAGDLAKPGMPFFVLEVLSRVKVTVSVPESDIVDISRGDAATVTVGVVDQRIDLVVDRIVPSGDTRSRTYEVQLLADNPKRTLKSGMFARVSFGKEQKEVLLVPQTAITRRGQLEGLFVVGDDEVARIRWVRVGPQREEGVEILSGLEPGERIVVAPPPGLVDGTPVA